MNEKCIVIVIFIHYLCQHKNKLTNYSHLKIMNMKKITFLLSFVACAIFAQGQTLLVENFDYAVGQELIPNGWANTGTAATPNIQVTASSITYTGYPGSGVGNEATLTNGQDVNKSFTAQTSGLVYVSFLVNVSAISLTGDYFIHLGADVMGSGFVGRVFVKKDATDKLAFGVQLNSGGTIVPTYSAFNYALNTTYLIVLKHDNTGKVSSIIVNPALASEPSTGWLNDSQGTNAMPLNIGSVGLRQPSASATLTAKIDGIRIATSWSALGLITSTTNPSSSSFKMHVDGRNLVVNNVADGSKVEIFSALGAKVQTSELTGGSVLLNNLSKGMYIVRVGKLTQKITL